MMTRKKREQRQGTCVYCGAVGPITSDHVFPELLFEQLDPHMVTVPACKPCNALKRGADEDLGLYVALDIGGSRRPYALALARKLISHERNSRRRRWLARAMAEAVDVDLERDNGIIVGRVARGEFNSDRIIR
jgi:hypothetical protein